MNTEILTKFGKCKISPCEPPFRVVDDRGRTKRSRPTHFLALRLNSPALYKNVGGKIVLDFIDRLSKFISC